MVAEAIHEVNSYPDNFEGNTPSMKIMHSDRVRNALTAIHNRRCWLRYASESLRFFNRRNMKVIDISEEEIMAYTDEREEGIDDVGNPPDGLSFYTPAYTLDSLTTLKHLTDRINELKAGK